MVVVVVVVMVVVVVVVVVVVEVAGAAAAAAAVAVVASFPYQKLLQFYGRCYVRFARKQNLKEKFPVASSVL